MEEAERFRRERFGTLRNVPSLDYKSSVIVHVLPLGRLGALHDLRGKAEQITRGLPPLQHAGWNQRYNADGFMTFTSTAQNLISSYSQLFRFGGVEGYSGGYVNERNTDGQGPVRYFWAQGLSKGLKEFVERAMQLGKELFDIEAPWIVLLTLRGLQGTVVHSETWWNHTPIDKDELWLPPLIVEYDTDLEFETRRLLDVVWQAAGFSGQP